MDVTGPPPWGDVNKGLGVIITTSIIVRLTAVVVALRWSVRLWITKKVWWDDWTILFAIVRQNLSRIAKRTLTSL